MSHNITYLFQLKWNINTSLYAQLCLNLYSFPTRVYYTQHSGVGRWKWLGGWQTTVWLSVQEAENVLFEIYTDYPVVGYKVCLQPCIYKSWHYDYVSLTLQYTKNIGGQTPLSKVWRGAQGPLVPTPMQQQWLKVQVECQWWLLQMM